MSSHSSGLLSQFSRVQQRNAPVQVRSFFAARAVLYQLTVDNMNPKYREMQYAVRGRLVLRAKEHLEKIKSYPSSHGLPFNSVIYCNIGNPQSVQQPPITFVRQLLAACTYPHITQVHSSNPELMPADVVERATRFLKQSDGVGAYCESKGIAMIRQSVKDFIINRDGLISDDIDVANIFLTNGASEGIKTLMSLLIRDENDGILIPIPQYPLYSATISTLGAFPVPYFLNEDSNWSLCLQDLENQVKKTRAQGKNPRAIVCINPGNPTGQILSYENMKDIVQFCERENLLIFADEVYQVNVYGEKPFISFRKVATDLKSKVEVASFHSVSKGVLGECGLRGGYMELLNCDPGIVEQIYKACSVNLCSNIPGQIVVDAMVNPPKSGDPSYDLYKKETDQIFSSLKRKAKHLAENLNQFPGMSVNFSEGAMYAFPKISLSAKAIAEAKKRSMTPDEFYCMELLDKTGICVVPGSGFGQATDTFHFRTTFLPPEDQMSKVILKMKAFHEDFNAKYA